MKNANERSTGTMTLLKDDAVEGASAPSEVRYGRLVIRTRLRAGLKLDGCSSPPSPPPTCTCKCNTCHSGGSLKLVKM
jgi:hypothetical protein